MGDAGELRPDAVRSLLVEAAREGRALSYGQVLGRFGHRFSRPLMRQLCRVLDRIDENASAAGEPALAVLVVRQADGLPGQGWWVSRASRTGYGGPWKGAEAARHVAAQQAQAFAYWAER